jgi:hypothetical protein
MENPRKARSMFWPIVLIGVGLIWLLVNLRIIPAFDLGLIFKLWPILLIVLGLDLIVGRKFPWVGSLIGLLAIGGVVAFLMMSPKLGIETSAQTKTETFSTPIGEAVSVDYHFEAASAPVEFNVLENSNELINAVIVHRGRMNFDVTGTKDKSVRLSETSDSSNWLTWDFSSDKLEWKIGLAPKIPTAIVLDGGSGSIAMNLSGISLSSLRADMGSGSSRFVLPKSDQEYTVEIDSGSGSINVSIPETTSLSFALSAGSGAVNISLPAGAAIQVVVMDDGSGSLSLPSGLEKVTSGTTSLALGTWQSPGYANAVNKILITIQSQGSGSISIR